jgi:hypothetical protein
VWAEFSAIDTNARANVQSAKKAQRAQRKQPNNNHNNISRTLITMKIEISIHASKLHNAAGAFKGTSDPFAVVTKIATQRSAKAEVLGKTEVIKNSLSPQWVKVFVLDYELGSNLKVAINIFDEVRKGENKSMGSAVFDIGELLVSFSYFCRLSVFHFSSDLFPFLTHFLPFVNNIYYRELEEIPRPRN